jgi:hypothetical protein
MKKSDLPFGSEFSPSQISLPKILEFAESNSGDWKAFEQEVKKEYFDSNNTSDYNKGKLANNAKLGMIAYGIINRDVSFTEFGKKLFSVRKNDKKLYAELAKHILLNLHGMTFTTCIQDMMTSGETVNLTTLRKGLEYRGIHYPAGGKHPSIMRLWLAKADVFHGTSWRVNEEKIEEILGISTDAFVELAEFSDEQKAFILALANTGTTEWQPANEIARLASATYGVEYPEKSLPKLVLNAIAEAGYVEKKKTTTGRGAKPFLVKPSPKLEQEIIEPLLKQISQQSDPKLRKLLKRPLIEIIKEIDSKNRNIRGLALEALGFKLMMLLDMKYVATRLRGKATGGAEVDLIFESDRLVYSRWQIQCKNTSTVSLDDVAKEVGLTHFLKSNAIIMVSTGKIGSEARRYANKVMADSNIAIVMMDGSDLKLINANPPSIIKVFQREAKHAMKLKQLEIN